MKENGEAQILLTVPESAKLLKISRSLAYDLIARGELPHVRLGRIIRIPRFGLEQWIAREAGVHSAPPEAVDFAHQPSQRH